MNVKEIMTTNPVTCTPGTNIAAAAEQMLKADCGVVPIVDSDGMLAGIVTDRDLFIALATRDRLASQLTVGEVARTDVVACDTDTKISAALAMMKQHHLRRLPVLRPDGTVAGVISMNDIILATGRRKSVRIDNVIETLQAICAHRIPATHIAA